MNAPLDLPGYAFAGLIGQGALADVFLYTAQDGPAAVAVKILRVPVTDPRQRLRFEAEAALLVPLSAHPSILTVHSAGIGGDDRVWLVLEHCSRPTLAQAAARAPLSVPAALQTVIRVAGGVESAHRAGILHRDIRPANVLTTDRGWSALADFGLAALAGPQNPQAGISLPWTAPEVLQGGPATPQADVYALAATTYAVLAGRAPFEDTRSGDLAAHAQRIIAAAVPPLGRTDVPPALEAALLRALAKDPAARPGSVAEFAFLLQGVERDLGFPVTQLDVVGEPGAGITPVAVSDDTVVAAHVPDDATVLVERAVGTVPEAPSLPDDATVLVRRDEPAEPADDSTVLVSRDAPVAPFEPADDATVLVPRTIGAEDADPVEEATILAPGRVAGPEPVADTSLLAADRIEPVLDEATRVVADAASAAPVVAPAGGARRAYSPGEEGVANRVYGIRSEAPAAPVVRSVPGASPSYVASQPQRRRRNGFGAVVLAIAGVVIVAGAIAGIVLLWGM